MKPSAQESPRFDGWRIVAVSALLQGLGVGLGFYFFAQIVTAVQAAFDTTRAGVMLAPTLGSVVGAACGPLAGALVDRGRIRALVVSGALLMGTSWLLMAASTELWQFVAFYATLQVVGHALAGPIVLTALVSNWFASRRGRALALAALGTSVAGFAVGPVVQLGLAQLGWRATCTIAGVAAIAFMVPPALLYVISHPERVGQTVDGAPRSAARGGASPDIDFRQLLRQRNFWCLTFGLGLLLSVQPLLQNNIVAYANDVGITGPRAGLITSALALGSLVGKLISSLGLDRLGRRAALLVTIGLQLAGWLFLCVREPDWVQFLAGASVFGLGTGALLPSMGAAVGACFGRASFGRAFGLMAPFRLPLVAASPLVGGLISDATGSYSLAFQLYLAAFAGSALLIALLRVPAHEPGM